MVRIRSSLQFGALFWTQKRLYIVYYQVQVSTTDSVNVHQELASFGPLIPGEHLHAAMQLERSLVVLRHANSLASLRHANVHCKGNP